jgi:uncharacterized protein YndB with AHSA1/START domain
MSTDQIEKKIVLRANRSRVWRALTDSNEFGSWFGMKLDGPFEPGATMRGGHRSHDGRSEDRRAAEAAQGRARRVGNREGRPRAAISFRWHPHAVQPGSDYAKEPMTLVTFTLDEVENGVLLTITESGFDSIPLARRAEAFKANEGGWSKQVELIAKYLARAA